MNLLALTLSIAVIAAFVLAVAGIRLISTGIRTKGWLMIGVALVLLANVFIMSWTPVTPK